MQIDAFTILLFGLFIKLVLGVLFLIFWLNDRRGAPWFAWWSATYFCGSLAALLFLTLDTNTRRIEDARAAEIAAAALHRTEVTA